jgi:prefoldin subunit 5
MSVQALKVEIDHLKESIRELKVDIKEYRKELQDLNDFVHEARLGRKWMLGILSASVMLGAFIDNILKWFKLY